MFDAPNIQQQEVIKELDGELLPEWFQLPYSTSLLDFVYGSQSRFQEEDIDTSFFTPKDWLFIRRNMPLFDVSIDNISKDVLASIREDLIEVLKDIGLAALIVWVLKKKRDGKVEIEGDSNIVGDNNQIKFSKSINNITVIVGTPPPDQEAMPFLAIYQPENNIKYFPLSSDFRRLDDAALKKALSVLGNTKRNDRLKAISTIKASGNEKFIRRLVPHILDKDPVVQSIAADAVAESQCIDAIPPLLQALENKDTPFRVKELLAFSLIELGGSNVISSLLNMYKNATSIPEYLNLPIKLACLNDDSIFKKILDQVMNGGKEDKLAAIFLLREIFRSQQFNFEVS